MYKFVIDCTVFITFIFTNIALHDRKYGVKRLTGKVSNEERQQNRKQKKNSNNTLPHSSFYFSCSVCLHKSHSQSENSSVDLSRNGNVSAYRMRWRERAKKFKCMSAWGCMRVNGRDSWSERERKKEWMSLTERKHTIDKRIEVIIQVVMVKRFCTVEINW